MMPFFLPPSPPPQLIARSLPWCVPFCSLLQVFGVLAEKAEQATEHVVKHRQQAELRLSKAGIDLRAGTLRVESAEPPPRGGADTAATQRVAEMERAAKQKIEALTAELASTKQAQQAERAELQACREELQRVAQELEHKAASLADVQKQLAAATAQVTELEEVNDTLRNQVGDEVRILNPLSP
mgnify:CR=1 FL=1